MTERKTYIVIVATLALVIIGLFLMYREVEAPGTNDTGAHSAAAKANLIVADFPLSGSRIASPVTITGKAHGNWYFEASFPIKIVNESGAILDQRPAQAQGEWMTSEFVPFSVRLSFPAQPTGSKGKIILEKDNPSGLPEYDDYLEIPITF